MEEENIRLLLDKLKETLSIIDDKYIDKIYNILISDSDYDKLFFKYVNDYKLDKNNIKQECIKYILKNTKSSFFNKNDITNYYNGNIEEKKENNIELKNVFFSNIYDEIDFGLTSFYESAYDLKKGLYDNDSIGMFDIKYGINKSVENIHIKLYLLTVYLEYYNYYLNYIPESVFFDYNDSFYEIYNDLLDTKDTFELINIFNENIDEILTTYNNYVTLKKNEIDNIHINSINTNIVNNLFNIYPPAIFAFRKYYGYKFNDEKIDSIRLGEITLEIVNNLIKESNGFIHKNIFKKTLLIINSKEYSENIYYWMMVLISNVYEHLLLDNKTKESNNYISVIENSNDYKNLMEDKKFMCYIIKKFYEYNHELFDEKALCDLNNKISIEKKKVIKKINPYYNQEENYL